MRILFVSLYNDESYGTRILHSILVNHGYDAKMLFFKIYEKERSVTEQEEYLFYKFLYIDYRPDLVCFSLTSPNWSLYKRLHKKYLHHRKFKLMLGGWQPSLQPQECIFYSDMICRGEGEKAVLEMVNKIANNDNLHMTSNFWVIDGGQISRGDVKPLDDIDYPVLKFDDNYSLYIENNKINYKDPYKINNRYGTMISKGCPYSCTYCSNSYMCKIYPNWSRIRYREDDAVIAELKEAKKQLPNINRINFYDEVLLPKNKQLFERYRQEISLPFYCMFYPGTCDERTAKILKEAGLEGIWLGIQSGSERVRKKVFRRYYTNEDIKKQVDIFMKYNINIKYDFIFDNPFETLKESMETLKLMVELPKPKSFNFFSLKFFPNTEITRMALEKNIIKQEDIDDQLEIEFPRYTISDEKEKLLERLIRKL